MALAKFSLVDIIKNGAESVPARGSPSRWGRHPSIARRSSALVERFDGLFDGYESLLYLLHDLRLVIKFFAKATQHTFKLIEMTCGIIVLPTIRFPFKDQIVQPTECFGANAVKQRLEFFIREQ